MARLYIGKNYNKGQSAVVQSIFRLAGSDEDALTYALGYLLARDPVFCRAVIRLFGIRLRMSFGSDYDVRLQEVTDRKFGRRDIVVEGPRFRIVIEAKIGGAEPTVEQLLKYADQSDLWERYGKGKRWIVALTQVELSEKTRVKVCRKLSKQGIEFRSVQWHGIVDLALKHKPSDDSVVSRYLFDEFIRFIRSDYRMGYHDAEVFIQDVDDFNEKIFREGWMYVASTRDKKAPLYFAPHFTRKGAKDKSGKGITMISRVMDTSVVKLNDIEDVKDIVNPPSTDHREKWSEGLCRIKAAYEANWNCRLLFLDKPFRFRSTPFVKANPPKEIPRQIPKGFSLRFDDLLRLASEGTES